MFLIFLFIIIITAIVLCFCWPEQEKKIAIAQFDKKAFNPQVEDKLLAIADWYEFAETADKEFEINDLKEFYEIVLELH